MQHIFEFEIGLAYKRSGNLVLTSEDGCLASCVVKKLLEEPPKTVQTYSFSVLGCFVAKDIRLCTWCKDRHG